MSMTSGGVPRLTLRQERAAFIRNRERLQDRVADQITAFSGSMAFVYLHVIWFALWCIGNLIWWQAHATAKARIDQSRALASANGSSQTR
jgi:uncharacterized membrane protein